MATRHVYPCIHKFIFIYVKMSSIKRARQIETQTESGAARAVGKARCKETTSFLTCPRTRQTAKEKQKPPLAE